MTALVERKLSKKWDPYREVYEYVLRASPHVSSR